MLRQEASIPSLVGLSVCRSSTKIICQRNLYLGQACARMLYSGIQTDDHVYTKCTVLFSLAQIQMLYTHPLSFFYVEAFGPTLVVLV